MFTFEEIEHSLNVMLTCQRFLEEYLYLEKIRLYAKCNHYIIKKLEITYKQKKTSATFLTL